MDDQANFSKAKRFSDKDEGDGWDIGKAVVIYLVGQDMLRSFNGS